MLVLLRKYTSEDKFWEPTYKNLNGIEDIK